MFAKEYCSGDHQALNGIDTVLDTILKGEKRYDCLVTV